MTELQTNLKLIGDITPGYTLSTSSMTLVNYFGWLTPIFRRYAGDNQGKTFEKIESILDLAVEEYQKENSEELRQLILGALVGVSNLKQTYAPSPEMVLALERLITKISETMQDLAELEERISLAMTNSEESKKCIPPPTEVLVTLSDRESSHSYGEETIGGTISSSDPESSDSLRASHGPTLKAQKKSLRLLTELEIKELMKYPS